MDTLKPARIHSANTISVMADDAPSYIVKLNLLSSSIKRDIVIEAKKLRYSPRPYSGVARILL